MTDFTLIRHGETRENITGLLQGQFDSRLNETGIRQARAAAERLRGEKFDALFSSDLSRAQTTAQILGEAVSLAPEYLPELREWALGELENRPVAELQTRYPEIMGAFAREPGREISVPGGESREQFAARVRRALTALAERYPDGKILLVTHGAFLREAFRFVTGSVNRGNLLPLISNAGYSRIVRRESGEWQLCVWNDVSHLKSCGVRERAAF